jgi:hypothetical protein
MASSDHQRQEGGGVALTDYLDVSLTATKAMMF